MKAPFLAGTDAVAAAAGRRGPGAAAALRSLPWPAVLIWAGLGAAIGGALFLRLYRLAGELTYYPDSYAQLRAIDNLLSGSFPISYLYPPGVALLLSPVFAVFPNTLATLQATLVVAGVAMVLVAYVTTAATTGDRRAAVFLAIAVAVSAAFVYYSRAALFDVVNAMAIAVCVFLAPHVARRGTPAQIAYGLLVFATVTVRYTNVALLPALLIVSWPAERSPSLRAAIDHARSRAAVTVLLTIAGLYVAYAATSVASLSRFGNGQSGSVIDLAGAPERWLHYVQATFTGYGELHWEDTLMAAALLAFAVTGGLRLWRTNPRLLVAATYLIAVWPPVHSLYNVYAGRYMMPAHYYVLTLAAVGLSVAIGGYPKLDRPWKRLSMALLLAVGVTLFVGRQLAYDLQLVQRWPADIAHGRELAYEPIRDALRSVDGANSVLISSQALAVDRANPPITTYDLIRHSETYGINDGSIERLLAYVRKQQAAGKTVYLHYTEFEYVGARFRKYELGFDAYVDALAQEYDLHEIARAHASGRHQRLYLLTPE